MHNFRRAGYLFAFLAVASLASVIVPSTGNALHSGSTFSFTGGSGTPVFTLINHSALGVASSGTTAPVDNTGANLIVLGCFSGGGAGPTCTDSSSNTWSKLNANTGATSFTNQIYYCSPCTVSAAQTFSITGSSNGGVCSMSFAGAKASAPFDIQGGDPGNTVTSSITPSVPGALVVSTMELNFGNSIATVSAPFAFTDNLPFAGGVSASLACAYVIQTTAIAAQATYAPAHVGANAIASFKP